MNHNEKVREAIEKASQTAEAFTEQLTQSWRVYAIGAAFLLSLSLGLLWYAIYRPTPSVAERAFVAPLIATSTKTGHSRLLDGVLVEHASATAYLPIAVMVENSIDAWPLSGVSKANLVYEAPVEGSITRFMLVYDPSTVAEEIGPVRSARPYYVEWADGMNAEYAHVGGSPAALALISSKEGFRDVNEYSNGDRFWRSSERSAPHNAYTSIEHLVAAAIEKEFEPSPFRSWLYEDLAEVSGTSTTSVSEGYSEEQHLQEKLIIPVPYLGAYGAAWEYDASSTEFIRYQNDRIQRDRDGSDVRVKNVVILHAPATVLDSTGRLSVRTTGSGKVVVYHDGKKYEGVWKRSDREPYRFETIDGRDIPFARGKTWISIVTTSAQFQQAVRSL